MQISYILEETLPRLQYLDHKILCCNHCTLLSQYYYIYLFMIAVTIIVVCNVGDSFTYEHFNCPVFSQSKYGKYRKIWTRKSSVFGHFSRSALIILAKKFTQIFLSGF